MIDLTIMPSLIQFNARSWYTEATRDYAVEHGLDLRHLLRLGTIPSVQPIRNCGHGRFDFGAIGLDPLGLVVEAIGEDGETPDDLIAWPVNDSSTVLSMHGRVGILGLWHAFNPATYIMGKPLTVHRTPLEYLQAGCEGAAIVDPMLASRQMLDLPGPIAGRDQEHGRELVRIAGLVVRPGRIVAATSTSFQREAA